MARAILRDGALDDAEGEGVDLRGADLAGATLTGAQLNDADFRGADLRGADLSRGSFRGADFRGALLDGARFDLSDCHGAAFDLGAGPQAAAESATRPDAERRYDDAVLATMRDLVRQLPDAFATPDGAGAPLLQEILHALERSNAEETAGDDALPLLRDLLAAVSSDDGPPKELEPILQVLRQMANGDSAPDVKALLDQLLALAPLFRPQPPAAT